MNLETNEGYEIGANYIIRLVTMIYMGKLVGITPTEYLLTNAVWVAETERYTEFLRSGAVTECEIYPPHLIVHISRGALADAVKFEGPLMTESK